MFGFFKHKNNQLDDDAMQSIKAQLDTQRLFGRSLMDFVDELRAEGDVLHVALTIPAQSDQREVEAVYHELQHLLHGMGVGELNFNVRLSDKVVQAFDPKSHNVKPPKPPQKSAPAQKDILPHPRIKHTVVIASGKGGVGKSTTAVNVALALQSLGHRVGILDADIYGPSVPHMLGVAGLKPEVDNGEFIPIEAHGLAMLSIGSLLDADSTPVAWRGIKATGALMQLYTQTSWPNLDYLIIDMPPGTGDIQLTLAQRIAITGAVVVTTPQHIALLDAKKGVEMFAKTDIPVLGIIENMALHTCSQCGHTEAIFGEGGADEMVAQYGVPLLGRLPLASGIRQKMDSGTPSVMTGDEFAQYYLDIAKAIDERIGIYAKTRNDGRIF